MKKQPVYFLVLLAVAALSFAACKNNADYRKTKSGMMYKIFSDSKDSVVKIGNIMKLNFTIKVGSSDSVLKTTVGEMPAFIPVQDVPADAYSQLEVFNMLRKGDSAVIVQLIDTIVKKTQQQLPPFFKKGDKIITLVKVLDVFKTPELATKDREAETAKERTRIEKQTEIDLVKGDADMAAWLSGKNIKAVKTGKGTYVVVKEPGTGMQADSGKYVTVRYEGKTLADGKVFESTMDPQKQPYSFQLGVPSERSPIRGWEDGLPLFKKGGKGTLYIPGALAYGKNPPPNSPFKPNEPLVFDIYLVDVSDTMPMAARPQQQELPPQIREQMEKQMREQQQKQQQQKPAH
jgi:FKBP-type peptidyl-prolyl cis-trans isomerase FkpA